MKKKFRKFADFIFRGQILYFLLSIGYEFFMKGSDGTSLNYLMLVIASISSAYLILSKRFE
ncbi:MAG: hypothetical protein ACRC6X_08325 [Culicoidibacterales bacterium]